MLVTVTTPAGNDRGPLYMEQALSALHQGSVRRLPLSFEYVAHAGSVTLACRFPDELKTNVEGQLYAQYPECHLAEVADPASSDAPGTAVWSAGLHLHPDLFPCRRYAQFEDALNRTSADPLTGILATLAPQGDRALRGHICIVVKPARKALRHRAEQCLHRVARPFFRTHPRVADLYVRLALAPRFPLRLLGFALGRLAREEALPVRGDALSTSTGRAHDREEDLQAASDKLGRLLFEAEVHLLVRCPPDADHLARRKLEEMAAAFGQFSSPRLASFRLSRIRRGEPRSSPPFLLSTEELATLWHPPTLAVRAQSMATVESREFEPPLTLPTPERHSGLAVLGTTHFRGREEHFGILPDDRRRHLAVLGKTGMGKTTLLRHLITSDILAGRGVGLLDPHGDLCESVLSSVPSHRTNDVILLDAGDQTTPVSLNLLADVRPGQRSLVASGILSTFKKLYGDFWGPRLEHILRNALLALLEVPGTSLLGVMRLLTDARYRAAILAQVTDPVVRSFWETEFAGMPPKLRAEATAPILNKVGAFISSPLLRNIVGQSRATLDLRRLMDRRKILLANLSKGRLGDDAAALLGSFLVTAVQLAAMSRADTAEENRSDFFLYVDEFQNYTTESFATILSEARKYGLALTIANQYLAQLDDGTADAIFGNVGTLVCFQVGANDAEILATQLGGGDLTVPDLLQLPRGHAYVRLLTDGMPSRPFSMRTLPPPLAGADAHRREIIRKTSRHRYGKPLPQVEREIAEALAVR